MKRFICLIMIAIMLSMIGCPSETAGSQTSVGTTQTTVPNDNTKITSLQAVIDAADVGAEIDLSKYASIENFDYNAKINKALTIQNGSDLKSAALTVVSDGVKLNGIRNASVTTNSSMKISGSSLSSLSIAEVPSSQSNANQIVSRGETVRSAQPPVVEVDNTTVDEDVSFGIANAYLNVKQFTAKKAIELGAANVQLTISDKATNIKEIKTDKICQVILEDGTSDTIPCSQDKISVTGSGELKQIDMTVKDGKRLIALTPVGGLTTAIQKDESIDFSTAVVLGTYQQTDGVAVFTAAGLSYNFTETFSKLEKDFIVKISEDVGDEGLPTVPLYQRGENQVYDWSSLSAGKHKAVIELVWDNRAEDYAYNFVITVIDGAAMPTFELTGIEIMAANVKTQYKAGEPLNLTGLIVSGTYAASVSDISYKGIVTDYTLTPPNGTILTADMDAVKVSVGTFTRTMPITVKSVLNVTFVIDAADEQNGTIVQTVLQGDKVSEQTPQNKQGYTFGGWYLKTGDSIADVTYDFGTIVSENITLVAKWTANVYTVTLNLNYDGSASTTIDATYDCKLSDITPPTRTGYEFQGYYEKNDGTGTAYYNINGVGGVWKIADNATLYAHWTPKQYAVSLMDGDCECDSMMATYNQKLSVEPNKIPTKTGYIFNGFWSALDGGVQYIDATGDGLKLWTASDDVSYDAAYDCYNLYAQWTANHYTIAFDANGGTGEMGSMSMTYDVSADLSACTFTRTNMIFNGWATSADGEVVYTDEQNVKNLTSDNGAEITLYAVWTVWTGILPNGNMQISGVEYKKTSMKQVLSESTTITCDQSDGVFPTARGTVTLGKYAIGKYPVTQELYTAVMGSNPSNFTETQAALGTNETSALLRPVEKVSWYDAMVFCNKLSLLMGKARCYKLSDGTYPEDAASIPTSNNTLWDNAACDWTADGYRLPTECEWECAARGGTYKAGTPWTYTYSGSNTVDDVAWYSSNSSNHTWEVGLKTANNLGIYDMSGNVFEWCWDNYNSSAIDSNTPVTGPASNSSSIFNRRLRGGSWYYDASFCTVSDRRDNPQVNRINCFGFRLACRGE